MAASTEYPDLYMSERSVVNEQHAARIRRSFPVVEYNGWSLLEHPALRYDEVRLDRASHTAITGEIAHVVYQHDLETIKEAMRLDLAGHLLRFARKVGIAYPLETR